MLSATVKFSEDSPIAAWLADMKAQGVEQSRAIRFALEQYLAQGGSSPPPPPVDPPPAPVGGFSLADLTQAVYQGILLAKNDGISIMQNAPLNSNGHQETTEEPEEETAQVTTIVNGKMVTVAARSRDEMMAEIDFGLNEWGSQ